MAAKSYLCRNSEFLIILIVFIVNCAGNDILGCGGFVKSHVSLDFAKIEIGLYTKAGSLKERTECAPTNGYYFVPLYEKGEYVLRVHPPAGWSFEPSEVALAVDGASDPCSSGQDINFAFNGFGITGKVITAGQTQGPSGIAVQLIDDEGQKRDTVTAAGGDFHFTPVIPGKYTVKATHPKWKLEPGQAVVQVKEGNTALPAGVLAVKGYDVRGSVSAFGSPIGGVYVLLYSKEESPKFRVEGCNTALLQGVPDAPICHAVTGPNGEFEFGLVPAGQYQLRALPQSPGQAILTFNVRPDAVPFTVAHDSLFIKNTFEVSGFTVVGSVLAHEGGPGVAGARVLLDGEPRGTADSGGKFTLPALQPGTYALAVQHEQCEFEEVQISVSPTGPRGAPVAVAARWRVCGQVAPPLARRVSLQPDRGGPALSVALSPDNTGKWCTFLPPGTYTAKVEVTEAEQSDGLQFYPVVRQVSVGHAPVDGVSFSQLKARVSGLVQCAPPAACLGLRVALRPLQADGGYAGQPLTTTAKDGAYEFSDVLPGSVEVSVGGEGERLCWQEARHNVAVTHETATVPTFIHTGHRVHIHSTHATEVEYSSNASSGVLAVTPGAHAYCVPSADKYALRPRGCHSFRPASAEADTAGDHLPVVKFVAIAHAAVVRVLSPSAVDDLRLRVDGGDGGPREVGPLAPKPAPGGGFLFEHTLHMADGEVAVVSAHCGSLLFVPADPQQVVGRSQCQQEALTLRAVPGLTLQGRLRPPVEGVTITLLSEENQPLHTQTTTAAGTYSFGPLDASRRYSVSAHKESYSFGPPDDKGDIAAHQLAQIAVTLVDDAQGTPLQGALVSVSGGAYRQVLAAGADGALRFPALAPTDYYVKPHMKEFRFAPPHTIVTVQEGRTHKLTLRGVRVAWSCLGSLVSVGGAGWGGVALAAVPLAPSPSDARDSNSNSACAAEEATTEPDGTFRIRGLLPSCKYTLQLKQSTEPDINSLKLIKAPPTLEIKDKKDIENVRLVATPPVESTDGAVLVRTPSLEHYRSLRLTLAREGAPHAPLYSAKLDPQGFGPTNNPGLVHVLPRLPADNSSYVLQLESTLSKTTHTYKDEAIYFNSDGKYKHFTIDFLPKVKSSEQELRQTSLLFIPLLGLACWAWLRRGQLGAALANALEASRAQGPRGPRGAARAPRHERERERELLDKASIDHIVNTVNAAGKRAPKKKAL